MRRALGFLTSVVLITGITTILLLVTAIGGELWFRYTLRRDVQAAAWRSAPITAANQTFAYHPWAAFRNTPGFLYQVGNLKYVKINRYGWRGPEPKIDRPKNVRRAVLLGDSVAFSGWGCREGVTLGGAMTRALELRTGDEWEVINMSVGGGFSSMSLATLAHEGMQFKPDVVVTLNGTNDLLVLEPAANWLSVGKAGRFKDVLYHSIQEKLENLYDPRTGGLNQYVMIDQFLSQSALFSQLKGHIKLNFQAPAVGDQTQAVRVGMAATRSTDNAEWLDHYVNNEIAMSYLSAGGGATFIAFLQPFFSLKHKVIGGDVDRELVRYLNETNPGLLGWLDAATPIMGAKLAKAAAAHPTLNYVDLSLMYTNEEVFADAVHMRCLDNGLSMPGNELLAGRMADEIVKKVYPGQAFPDWRKTHIEGAPHDWNDRAYLDANPDVAALVAAGTYTNGYKHYIETGFLKGRPSGFPSWNEKSYLEANLDISEAVKTGRFASGFDHYLKAGRAEGRLKGLRPRWVEESYLWAHPDVAQAVKRGDFKSGLDHYTRAGAKEGRNGGFSGWDEEGYLFSHGDVRNATERGTFKSGLDHYYQAGAAERRPIRLGTYTQKE